MLLVHSPVSTNSSCNMSPYCFDVPEHFWRSSLSVGPLGFLNVVFDLWAGFFIFFFS